MAREVTVTIETTSAGITVDPGETRVVRLYRDGDPVPSINGLPAGGTTGQVLAKASNADYDADWVTGGGGAAVWGGIAGTLSDQTDLQAALDAKEASGTAAAAVSAHAAAADPHPNYALESSLGTAATSNDYNDLDNLPTLGTAAAANTGDFATSAQGALADTAVQPAAIATKLDDLSAGTADAIVTASADGTLLSRAAYTIATLLAAARDRATHTGTQLAATISDFAAAALSAVTWSTLTGKPSVFTPDAHTHPLSDLTQSGASSGQVATWNGSAWEPTTPATTSPGGSSGQVQFNNSGAFGGSNLFTVSGASFIVSNNDPATTYLSLSHGSTSYSINGRVLNGQTARIYSDGAGRWLFDNGAGSLGGLMVDHTNGTRVNSTAYIGWTASNAYNGTPDTLLYRDAAGYIAQRNGTNAQSFRVANTWTDASNYEMARMEWAGNVLYIGYTHAGTGSTSRPVFLYAGSAGSVVIGNSTKSMKFVNTGAGVLQVPQLIESKSTTLSLRGFQNTGGNAAGKDIQVYGSNAIGTSDNVGGSAYVFGGSGASGASGAADGGHVYLDGGLGYGTGVDGDIIVGATYGDLRLKSSTVASLPSASVAGRRRFVTDANATIFYSIVAGGGSNYVPVFSDGTNWRIG